MNISPAYENGFFKMELAVSLVVDPIRSLTGKSNSHFFIDQMLRVSSTT